MMDECLHYRWPGNVRELENVVKQTVILGEVSARKALSLNAVHAAVVVPDAAATVLNACHLVEPARPGIDVMAAAILDVGVDLDLKRASRLAARQAEATMILRMLQQTRGNRKQGAINLGVRYETLLYKAKEHGFSTRLPNSRRRVHEITMGAGVPSPG